VNVTVASGLDVRNIEVSSSMRPARPRRLWT
jgi:hypothetical protein